MYVEEEKNDERDEVNKEEYVEKGISIIITLLTVVE